MIKNKKAESLVGIIIAVFILSFTMLGILNIFGFNKGIETTYKDNVYTHIIKGNSENLIKKLNIPDMEDKEFFYIKRDKTNKTFNILTGTTNEEYQYIDYLGNKVNPNTNIGKTYKRLFQFKADILRHVIYPNEIPNINFWFDGTNINGNNNVGLSEGDEISVLKDISGNGNDAYQNNSGTKPKLKKVAIKDKDALQFDGIDDTLIMDDDELINTDNDSNKKLKGIIYNQRSLAIVLKTGDDITSDQIVYEEGGALRGYSFVIHEGDLYAGVRNKYERDGSDDHHQIKSVNLGEILPDTIFFITIVQDSSHGEYNSDDDPQDNTFDDSANRLKIYLNGELASETDHVDPQVEHDRDIGIGAINQGTVLPRPPYEGLRKDANGDRIEGYRFKGYLGELIEWNHALSDTELRGLQNYFEQKWYDRVDNVRYNIIKTSSYKVVE